MLLAANLTAPDWVRVRFAKSLPPSLLLLPFQSDCKYLRLCRLLNCPLSVSSTSRLPPCRLTGGSAALFFHPHTSRPSASGVLARDVGGCLRSSVHVSQISINDRLLTATDRLRPPRRMYLTVGNATTWCPMRARACRSHINPKSEQLSASSLVSKTTKHPFLPVAIQSSA